MEPDDLERCNEHGREYRVLTGRKGLDCPEHREARRRLFMAGAERKVHVAEPKWGDEGDVDDNFLDARRSERRASLLIVAGMVGALVFLIGLAVILSLFQGHLDEAVRQIGRAG